MDVIQHLLPQSSSVPETSSPTNGRSQLLWFPEKEISMESFVVGALESTFYDMVSVFYGRRSSSSDIYFL